jgi:hypothetical protein
MVVAAQMLNLPLSELGKALFPSAASGALMGGMVLAFLTLTKDSGDWVQLLGSVLFGGLTYIGCLWLIQRDIFSDTVKIFQGALKKG